MPKRFAKALMSKPTENSVKIQIDYRKLDLKADQYSKPTCKGNSLFS